MDPASLLKPTIVASIVLFVIAIGLVAPPGSIRAGFRDPLVIARAMLAMFLLFPAFTFLVSMLLPLEPAARAALMALAVSPMPPILPAKEQKVGGGIDYALAIQIAASAVALIAAPLLIFLVGQFFDRELSLDFMGVATAIFVTIVAPLAVGIAIAAVKPDLAARVAGPMRMVATALLVVAVLILLWQLLPNILAATTWPVLVAMALMTAFGLAIGHWLGGPDRGNRHALAFATVSRHPGVAIGVASAATFAPAQPVVATILLYLLASGLMSLPYSRWAQGRI